MRSKEGVYAPFYANKAYMGSRYKPKRNVVEWSASLPGLFIPGKNHGTHLRGWVGLFVYV
jgi:hypothetical protein